MRKLCAWLLSLTMVLGMAAPGLAAEETSVLPLTLVQDGGDWDAGSAFLLEDGSMAVTAYHLLAGVKTARVGGIDVLGLVGYDAETDVAILRLASSAGAGLPLAAEDARKGDAVTKVTATGSEATTVTALVHTGSVAALRVPDDGRSCGGALLSGDAVVGVLCGVWCEADGYGVAATARSIRAVYETARAAGFAVTPLSSRTRAAEDLNLWEGLPAADAAADSEVDSAKDAAAADGEADSAKDAKTAGSILEDLLGPAEAAQNAWVLDFSLEITAANMLTVDWSGCEIAGRDETSVIGVIYARVSDPYLMVYTAEAEDGDRVELAMIPGETYYVTVQHAHGEIDAAMEMSQTETEHGLALVTMPRADALDAYGCTTGDITIGAAKAGTEVTQGTALPAVTVTAEVLADETTDLHFQCVSRYVTDTDSTVLMQLVLTAPDGSCYEERGAFTFVAGLTEDVWSMPMQSIRARYAAYHDAWQTGDYTLTLYLDGAVAATRWFTLK